MEIPRSVILALALPALCNRAVGGEDWPQFRGPTGQRHSTEIGLPLEWSETHNVVWKVPVAGRGWSSPVVAGDLVWLTTAVDGENVSLRALAFDVDTGHDSAQHQSFVGQLQHPEIGHIKDLFAAL